MKQGVDEIRRMSADKLAADRQVAALIHETTPGAITPAIAAFCSSIAEGRPMFVPAIDDPDGLFGWCSDGVEQKVIRFGGSIAYGWCIWEWPNVFLTAEFHAVWHSPEGTYIDITPKPNRETKILFLVDASYAPGFDFDRRPGNRPSPRRSSSSFSLTLSRSKP